MELQEETITGVVEEITFQIINAAARTAITISALLSAKLNPADKRRLVI